MANLTPAEIAEKWSRKMQGATTDYANGVQRVTQAPGQKAAANVQGYQQGVQRAVANGKWAANVARVSLQDWQQAAVNKGAARLAAGAAAAVSKVEAAQARIAPMRQAALQSIANMPRTTPEQRIQRSAAFQTAMMNAANRNGGR